MSTPARRAMRFSWSVVEVWSSIRSRASAPRCPPRSPVRGEPRHPMLPVFDIQFFSCRARYRSTWPDPCSALALLVTRVRLADDHDATVTTDHAAVVADGLDAGVDLHDVSCSLSSPGRRERLGCYFSTDQR